MADLFDYIYWRGDLSFKNDRVNEIDGIIFSRLIYLDLGNFISKDFSNPIKLKELADKINSNKNIKDYYRMEEDLELLNALKDTHRFGDIKIYAYHEKMDIDNEEQFAGVVFELNTEEIFISFRGTDATLVGWKENFNMSFMSPVPSQVKALKYLEFVANTVNHSIYIGGHSKGGNLAIYSGAFCNMDIQDRIIDIYNYDGPGFHRETIDNSGFLNIEDRINTFVPQSSIIGMLLERKEPYKLVKSDGYSLFQHNVYRWFINPNKLIYLDKATESSVFFSETIKLWVQSLEMEEIEILVETLFDVLGSAKANTPDELMINISGNLKTIYNSYKSIDKDTSDSLDKTINNLWKAIQLSISIGIDKKIDEKIDGSKE